MRLRMGIPTKLVATLVLAGLLPLLLSLAVLVFSVVRIRTSSVGASFQAAARQEANHLATLLSSQMEFAYLLSRLPGTAEFLQSATAAPTTNPADIEQIEARWAELTPADEPLKSILNNPVAARWRAVRQQRVRFAEVLITDAAGNLVAATNKTTDYEQGDEDWWRACISSPPGTVHLNDSTWDASALSATGEQGVPVLDLCLPLYPEDESGAILGVMKVSIDTSWLSDQLQADVLSGYAEPKIGLIHATGIPVGHEDREGVAAMISPAALEVLRSEQSNWIVSRQVGEDVIGFAAVNLPEARLDVVSELDWYVVVAASRTTVMAPLRRLVWQMVGVGLLTAAVWFAGGLWIARREIIRPLLALRKGVAELEKGNINYRLAVNSVANGRAVFRDDEIGQLAHDFNTMADRLREILQQLERADLLKQQFIDVASHELRTPVTYILGVSELAERHGGNPLLAKILPKAKRLGRILDNMFKLLQSGSYETALHVSRVDLRALIDVAVEELAPFLEERRQTLDREIAAHLPTIEADPEKIRDVLSNLLSNAIRFSPDGATITIAAGSTESGVEIVVRDTGVGIDREDLPHLFEPFFPPPRSGVMHHTSGEYAFGTRGIGLGLSVVKRFVELHGGTIQVQSSEHGTVMRVRLPLKATGVLATPLDPASAI